MLGFSKIFVVFLFFSAGMAYYVKDIKVGLQMMVIFAGVMVVWKFFTQ